MEWNDIKRYLSKGLKAAIAQAVGRLVVGTALSFMVLTVNWENFDVMSLFTLGLAGFGGLVGYFAVSGYVLEKWFKWPAGE